MRVKDLKGELLACVSWTTEGGTVWLIHIKGHQYDSCCVAVQLRKQPIEHAMVLEMAGWQAYARNALEHHCAVLSELSAVRYYASWDHEKPLQQAVEEEARLRARIPANLMGDRVSVNLGPIV